MLVVDPLTVLALVLVSGALLGQVAKRLHLPAVTGQILAGALLGPAALGVVPAEATEHLSLFTRFALGLMALTVGSHLGIRRLRNAGRRLAWLLLLEATVTPVICFTLLRGVGGVGFDTALLLATVAVSTAPATVVALVAETRAKGVFVKTLIAAVALDNIACVVLFELARAVSRGRLDPEMGGQDVWAIAAAPLRQLLLSGVIGAVAGVAIVAFTRRTVRASRLTTAALITLLAVLGVAQLCDASPLLACLFLGATQANLTPNKDEFVEAWFDNLRPAMFAVFFTLAGLHLRIEDWSVAGLVALAVGGRIVGKIVAGRLAMTWAGATRRVRDNLGIALVPQAGLAVGLVVLVEDDPLFAPILDVFVATVLGSVAVNEVIGPLLTRLALRRASEVGRDRARVLDFLQEENITTKLQATTVEEAIEQLVDLLIHSHHLQGVDRDALLRSVLEREAQVSTCIGQGLAIPHGDLPAGERMVGVMAISREGLPFPTPDGRPVHCMVLVATPSGARDRHLEVLAALARLVGTDPGVQQALFTADSAAHAYEVLHGDEAESFNRYLEQA